MKTHRGPWGSFGNTSGLFPLKFLRMKNVLISANLRNPPSPLFRKKQYSIARKFLLRLVPTLKTPGGRGHVAAVRIVVERPSPQFIPE